jgi:ribosomal protein L21E
MGKQKSKLNEMNKAQFLAEQKRRRAAGQFKGLMNKINGPIPKAPEDSSYVQALKDQGVNLAPPTKAEKINMISSEAEEIAHEAARLGLTDDDMIENDQNGKLLTSAFKKPRATPPSTCQYDFKPGQSVAVITNNKPVPGYTYVRCTGKMHVVAKDGKESRIWLQYVFPAA